MPNDGSVINGVATAGPCADPCDLEKQCVEGRDFHSSVDSATADGDHTVINIVVSNGESFNQVDVIPEPVGKISNAVDSTIRGEVADAVSLKKPHLSRNNSSHEQCRVCQQEKEEDLIDLGCQCRGGLAKAHRLCINTWFRMRGSNRCEICQQVAANVAPPESQPSQASYWVWRVDPVFGSTIGQERQRGCFSPLWVAFSILIGGLLLDVLISITLGVSALPVNIIIGVVVLLGLGTALRLAVEFCHEWGVRRVVQRVETNVNVNLGYHPAL